MVVLTNPGSNLTPEHLRRFEIVLTPQVINVDGVMQDTRNIQTLDTIDEWVRTAKKHPFVLGTSAAEFVAIFRDIGRTQNEILGVMTSRKIIGSHDSAQAAIRTMAMLPGSPKLTIRLVDSKATDVAAGLVTIFCAAAAKDGKPIETIAAAAEKLANSGRVTFVPQTIDYLVKGGRASFLKAWAADILKISPMLSFVDGEIENVGKVSRRDDMSEPMADMLLEQIGGRRDVWAAVAHGNNAIGAMAVATRLRDRFNVRYLNVQPLSPSIYLHGGPGCVLASVYPIDELPWTPAPPDRV